MARRAAYLFCFNPASVFYSAVYSESLFAFLTFSGALSLALGRPYRAAVAFFASSTARSNGTPRPAASAVMRCASWHCDHPDT
jgi:phosphatidylinositol glycan class V